MPLTIRHFARAFLLFVGCAVAILLGLVAVSRSDASPAWRTPRPWSPPARSPVAAGMIVAIDPETGKLVMPTEAQRARMAASTATRATSARPAPVYHLDGSVSLDTHEWMRDYAVIRTGPGGKLVFSCLDTRDQALRTMHAPVPPPAKEER